MNSKLLKDLVRAQGELGLAKTSLGALISTGTLMKMMGGSYGRLPRQPTRDRLCGFFGVSEDELFPVSGGGKAS